AILTLGVEVLDLGLVTAKLGPCDLRADAKFPCNVGHGDLVTADLLGRLAGSLPSILLRLDLIGLTLRLLGILLGIDRAAESRLVLDEPFVGLRQLDLAL